MEKKHETDSNALHLAEEVEESAAEPQTKKKRVDTYYDDQANYASIVKKDELTLMVRQLHPRTGEFDLFELFSKKGKVIDVKLVKDERSNRCIGVAYVEMSADTEVDNALTLNGEPLCGSHIVVQRSMALKNRMASAGATAHEIKMASTALNDPSTASQVAAAAGTGVVPPGMAGIIPPPPPPGRPGGGGGAPSQMGSAEGGIKVYVGGLDFSFSEFQVREIFSAFGELERVDLQRDPSTYQSRGFAFVHFKRSADGIRCCDQMNLTEIAGRQIKVNVAGSQAAREVGQQLSSHAANGGGGGSLGGVGGSSRAGSSGRNDDAVTSLDGLDDGAGRAGIGEKLGASQRASLLVKLASNAGMEVPDATRKLAAQSGGLLPGGGAASESLQAAANESRCVVLKNMFDRLCEEAQSDPDGFFKELAEDVRGECQKLGTVLFVGADKWSNGFVYVKMLTNPEASRVMDLMHGRYFAKQKILASLVDELTLDKKFRLNGKR